MPTVEFTRLATGNEMSVSRILMGSAKATRASVRKEKSAEACIFDSFLGRGS